jgi:hypothetical protein
MQGAELIDRLLLGRPETTYPTPDVVNAPGRRGAARGATIPLQART